MQFIFLNLFIDMKIEIVHSANHHQLGGAKTITCTLRARVTAINKKAETPCFYKEFRLLTIQLPAGLEPATYALRMRCSTN